MQQLVTGKGLGFGIVNSLLLDGLYRCSDMGKNFERE